MATRSPRRPGKLRSNASDGSAPHDVACKMLRYHSRRQIRRTGRAFKRDIPHAKIGKHMATPPHNEGRLIWIDLEMTGLDTDHDSIIEIATIVTDSQLNILAEGPELAIAQSLSTLEAMDDWNRKQHGKSGLWRRVLEEGVGMADAEARTVSFLSEWVPANMSPMCGNSICQDRRFLHRLMPRLEQHFHYRNLDVSTLKELARRWAPQILTGMHKEAAHTALSDVRDSINELRYYRQHFAAFEAQPE
jgi:oligoribonuclease